MTFSDDPAWTDMDRSIIDYLRSFEVSCIIDATGFRLVPFVIARPFVIQFNVVLFLYIYIYRVWFDITMFHGIMNP